MTRLGGVVAAFILVLVCGTAPSASAVTAGHLTLSLDRRSDTAKAGGTFVVRATLHNTSSVTVRGAIAHLDVVALDPSVYVDPEDWSGERTRYVPPLAPAESLPLTWRVKAVNAGDFDVYVVVDVPASRAIAATAQERVHVRTQPSLGGANALPVSASIPAVLLVLLVLQTYRRRRRR